MYVLLDRRLFTWNWNTINWSMIAPFVREEKVDSWKSAIIAVLYGS
jgi:hypothetical protein